MNVHTEYDARRNPAEPFEWEELPSLAPGLVLRRHVPRASYALAADLVAEARGRMLSAPPQAPAWIDTAAASLDPLTPSPPLAETSVGGLEAREILEPDVFKHFFGSASHRS